MSPSSFVRGTKNGRRLPNADETTDDTPAMVANQRDPSSGVMRDATKLHC
jgi:hypothetical protein